MQQRRIKKFVKANKAALKAVGVVANMSDFTKNAALLVVGNPGLIKQMGQGNR